MFVRGLKKNLEMIKGDVMQFLVCLVSGTVHKWQRQWWSKQGGFNVCNLHFCYLVFLSDISIGERLDAYSDFW